MKVFYIKRPPNIVRYRNYKNFNNEVVINDFNEYFTENTEFLGFNSFKRTIDRNLEKYTPLEKRYIRENQAPFMNTLKPFFTHKIQTKSKITLIERLKRKTQFQMQLVSIEIIQVPS